MLGLTRTDAEKRLKEDGRNVLESKKSAGAMKIFLGQFRDIMVIILLCATVISVLLGEVCDAVTIILIVFLNAVLGFVQEYKTEKTLETLRNMTTPTAKVYRDGKLEEISSEDIVCGDIVEMEAGDKVPADCVITEAGNVTADESILTGEPIAVPKNKGNEYDTDNSLNRSTILYSGTNITRGHVQAKVIATGKNTQIGKISGMIADIEETRTPLQKRLGELGKVVAVICIAVCVVVFLAGVIRGEPVFDMLLTGITIAIAAIPEGLPATVTIALALAVNRMMSVNALVNKLHSVETLGCASVICSDKTGTITENKMTVTEIYTDDKTIEVTGLGYKIAGQIKYDGNTINPVSCPPLTELFKCGILCNNAEITTENTIATRNRGTLDTVGEWKTTGDATEIAILVAGVKGGITAGSLKYEYRRINEEPFDSQTKMMNVTVRSNSGSITTYIKGASEVIIPKCSYIMKGKNIEKLGYSERNRLEKTVNDMSDKALRVIAFAKKNDSDNADSGLIFLGFMGMIDPPREEAREAIRLCRKASIKTVMITGDHRNTAVAIAKKAGLLMGKKAMTGKELDALSDEELENVIDDYTVFARVSPSHKLRLVRAYKKKGNIVTMTGDGVNDAPAIKEADVGVAMGITGTDVTKESADVILLDDNFATLVKAVEQGRSIYSNIRKFVRYLLSCNIGEVLTMFLGIVLGLPVVLLPTQLLLVNLVTDGLPAIALGVEPLDREVMKRPPRKLNESFFSGGLGFKIIFRGIMIGLCTLGSFMLILKSGAGISTARTAGLMTLVISQLLHVFECKDEKGNIFTVPYFNNIKLIFAVLVSGIIIFASVYFPPLRTIFETVPLNAEELGISLGFAFIMPIINCIVRV